MTAQASTFQQARRRPFGVFHALTKAMMKETQSGVQFPCMHLFRRRVAVVKFQENRAPMGTISKDTLRMGVARGADRLTQAHTPSNSKKRHNHTQLATSIRPFSRRVRARRSGRAFTPSSPTPENAFILPRHPHTPRTFRSGARATTHSPPTAPLTMRQTTRNGRWCGRLSGKPGSPDTACASDSPDGGAAIFVSRSTAEQHSPGSGRFLSRQPATNGRSSMSSSRAG
jgi:hypothetical protein